MIKVIDLLNIIAKGENKIPTKIKYLNKIYTYNGLDYVYDEVEYNNEYDFVIKVHLMDRVALCEKWLNEKVEIISYE